MIVHTAHRFRSLPSGIISPSSALASPAFTEFGNLARPGRGSFHAGSVRVMGAPTMTDPSPHSRNGSTPPPIIPEVLRAYANEERWVVWNYVVRKGKKTKPPYNPRRVRQPQTDYAKNDDPSTWGTLNEACAALERLTWLEGIGIELGGSDICAFDLDNCRATTGRLHPWAEELVKKCNSYTEVTVSETGIRIYGRTRVTGSGEGRKQKVDGDFSCETYRATNRYTVVTGRHLDGTPMTLAYLDEIMDQTVAELDALNSSSGRAEDADAEDDKSPQDTEELPRSLTVKLHIPNLGASVPHAGYDSRNELLFAFITELLRARISASTIKTVCLDARYRNCAIYEHCQENGGRNYVTRQIKQAREKLKESLDAEIVAINKTHALVLSGNKASIMKFEKIAGKDQFRLLQVGAFKIWFANQHVPVGKEGDDARRFLDRPQRSP